MILNIRGTSGSGKSTLARRIMDLYPAHKPKHKAGRKRPISVLCRDAVHGTLEVIGHYDTPCGGTDTITEQDEIFDRVRKAAAVGHDVLFEGLLISAEFNRMAALAENHHVLVLHLDVPLEVCLASVEQRRQETYEAKKAAGGNPKEPKPLNPKNTESKWKGTRRTVERLREAGVPVVVGDRDECFQTAREALGL